MTDGFHHQKLPDHSTLLCGHTPPDDVGFSTQALQIWYNHQEGPWRDGPAHAHTQSDECFIVLKGRLVVQVDDERYTIGPREFCCFRRGVIHCILEVHDPVETLMLRAPSMDDKIHPQEQN
jgi:mannose-6-phosphate isomerase-like protein (cupin superfamily)